MEKVPTVEVDTECADAIDRAASAKERVVLTRGGEPLAAIVPIEDLELIQYVEDRIDVEQAREALAEAEREGTIPWDRIKAETGLI